MKLRNQEIFMHNVQVLKLKIFETLLLISEMSFYMYIIRTQLF